MCLALYIASPKPLPVIPWDPEKPAFHVIPLPENRNDVRKLLPYPHIYYVGSHEGCSCAFNYEHDFKAVIQLRDYLRKTLAVTDEIAGFSCRPDQEQMVVKHSVTVSPTAIAMPEFFFQDGQRLVFRSRKTMLAQRRRASRRAVSRHKSANSRARSVKRRD